MSIYRLSPIWREPARKLLSSLLILTLIALSLASCAQRPVASSFPTDEPSPVVTAPEPTDSLPPDEPSPIVTVLKPTATTVAKPPVSLQKGAEPLIYVGNPAASMAVATSRVHFSVMVPKVIPPGYVLDAISTSYPEEAPFEGVRILYKKGEHYMVVGQSTFDTTKLQPLTDEWLAENRQQKITVGGHPGIGHEGGVIKWGNGTLQEYSAVNWWPPGLSVSVWSVNDASITLADLLKVAESMEVVR